MTTKFTIQVPQVHQARHAHTWRNCQTPVSTAKAYEWLPARPLNVVRNPFLNLCRRFRVAFLVFIGRYDAVDWEH